MHEVSLVQSLFDGVDRAIGAHPRSAVRQVTVRIGELAGVERVLFETAFSGCRTERGYDAAALTITEERAAYRCALCDAPIAYGGPLRCASCDGAARLVAGGEIFLDRVELEVVDV